MSKKIFLDTDIGSDIDDAICLSYLLANPECELIGITTVTGEPEKRANLARKLCGQAGKDIPVVSGRSSPLIIPQRQPTAEQAKVLETWGENVSGAAASTNAIDFMRQAIKENPHEVTLLGIGPLTNIATLFLADPEIPDLLEGLVLMCGCFRGSTLENLFVEWNALCDPHAAEMVYQTPVKKHISIGLDVTRKVALSPSEFRYTFSKGWLANLLDYANVWFEQENLVTFHDPLAAMAIFEPDIVELETGVVQVDTTNLRTMGFTSFSSEEKGPHSIAKDVDVDRFFTTYFSYFT